MGCEKDFDMLAQLCQQDPDFWSVKLHTAWLCCVIICCV